jgi:hypothetical protein
MPLSSEYGLLGLVTRSFIQRCHFSGGFAVFIFRTAPGKMIIFYQPLRCHGAEGRPLNFHSNKKLTSLELQSVTSIFP